MSPLRLYDHPVSGNCYKVRLLLAQLGLEHERVEVDILSGARDPAFAARSPNARVPLLELEDGRVLAESNAILWYLARGTPFLPGEPFEQATVLQWQFFEQNNVEPNLAVARQWVVVLGKEAEMAPHLELRRRGGREALGNMERHLRGHPFFAAERYTIADISLYAYTHVAAEAGFDLEPYPSLRAWFRRVEEQPGYLPLAS